MTKPEDDGKARSPGRALRRAAVLALVGVGFFFVPEGLDRLLLRSAGPGEAVVEGQVLRTRESSGSSGTSSRGDGITFFYRVAGTAYCSGGRTVGVAEGDPAEVCANEYVRVNRATVDAYAPGDAIEVVHEVARPSVAFPVQAPHRRIPWWIAGLFLLGLAGLLLRVGLRGPIDLTRRSSGDEG